jgi:hypothetical protein
MIEFTGKIRLDQKNFHILARYIPKDRIDNEVKEKLDAIVKTAQAQ